MDNKLKAPLIVQWEVTYDCNKNCVHCYNYWRSEKTLIKKSSNFYDSYAQNIVKQIIDNEVFQVVITGGEPLLVFEELYPYLEELKKYGVDVSINTNLALFTQDIADKLKAININSFLVSVPASNAQLDRDITNSDEAFRKTIEGIVLAVKNGFNISANMVVSKLNYNDIFETAKLVRDLGVKKFSVTRAVKPSNCSNFEKYRINNDEFRRLPEMLKKIKDELELDVFSVEAYPLCFHSNYNLLKETGFSRICTAGKTFCAIDPRGQVRPCILINDNRGTNLAEAWKSMDSYRDDSMLPKDCFKCKYSNICGGGCKAERLHSCGDYKCVDPYADLNNLYEINTTDKVSDNRANIGIDINNDLMLNKNLKLRREEFGGLLYLSNNNFIAVDSNLYNFFETHRSFSLKDLIKITGYEKNALILTLDYLFKRKIIKYYE